MSRFEDTEHQPAYEEGFREGVSFKEQEIAKLQPASDALDAAKLAFGGRVELTIRSSICMGCRKGTPRRFAASWAQPSWIHGAKSGDFLCGVQCALDLKTLLSTSAVKED